MKAFWKLFSKIQRTQIESHSQLWFNGKERFESCFQRYKELKLKAIHNAFGFRFENNRAVFKDTKNSN